MFLLIKPMAVSEPVRTTTALDFPLVTVVPWEKEDSIEFKKIASENQKEMEGRERFAYREDHVILILDGNLGVVQGLDLLVLANTLSGENGLINGNGSGINGNNTTVSGDLVSN